MADLKNQKVEALVKKAVEDMYERDHPKKENGKIVKDGKKTVMEDGAAKPIGAIEVDIEKEAKAKSAKRDEQPVTVAYKFTDEKIEKTGSVTIRKPELMRIALMERVIHFQEKAASPKKEDLEKAVGAFLEKVEVTAKDKFGGNIDKAYDSVREELVNKYKEAAKKVDNKKDKITEKDGSNLKRIAQGLSNEENAFAQAADAGISANWTIPSTKLDEQLKGAVAKIGGGMVLGSKA